LSCGKNSAEDLKLAVLSALKLRKEHLEIENLHHMGYASPSRICPAFSAVQLGFQIQKSARNHRTELCRGCSITSEWAIAKFSAPPGTIKLFEAPFTPFPPQFPRKAAAQDQRLAFL
jgi:hypothetical protein